MHNKIFTTIIVLISLACLIIGGFLFRTEWEMRQPDDLGGDDALSEESMGDVTDEMILPDEGEPLDMENAPFVTEDELYELLETSSIPVSSPLLLSIAMPMSKSSPTVVKMDAPKLKKDEIGILTLNKKRFHIKKGATEKILEKHIGWVNTSALPGEKGLSILQGHRDHELRALKGMKRGNKIAVTLADGTTYIFTIKSIVTMENDEAIDYTAKYTRELMITTCYPFYFTGKAPQKYVLRAAL